jgi:hypothetical protein
MTMYRAIIYFMVLFVIIYSLLRFHSHLTRSSSFLIPRLLPSNYSSASVCPPTSSASFAPSQYILLWLFCSPFSPISLRLLQHLPPSSSTLSLFLLFPQLLFVLLLFKPFSFFPSSCSYMYIILLLLLPSVSASPSSYLFPFFFLTLSYSSTLSPPVFFIFSFSSS